MRNDSGLVNDFPSFEDTDEEMNRSTKVCSRISKFAQYDNILLTIPPISKQCS